MSNAASDRLAAWKKYAAELDRIEDRLDLTREQKARAIETLRYCLACVGGR